MRCAPDEGRRAVSICVGSTGPAFEPGPKHIKRESIVTEAIWQSSHLCRHAQSLLEGLSQVRPTDEEEPHEMNQKGGAAASSMRTALAT